nr:pyridoxal-phosphate dependent enzyme [Nodosilinea sp. LEGE 07088]
MLIHRDITAVVGHTPLVKLQRLPPQFGCGAEIVLKLEGMNPAKSVKDRIAISMILEAEEAGLIQSGVATIVAVYAGLHLGQRDRYRNQRIVIIQPSGGSATSARPCDMGCILTIR